MARQIVPPTVLASGRAFALTLTLASLAAWAIASPSQAEIVEQDADHFVLRYDVAIETTPDDIYQAIGEVGQWWDGAHTYGGDATKLSLALTPGACFCEALADGTTFEHGRVKTADPDTGVLLAAPLGPLKGKTTVADWSLGWTEANGGYDLIMTYVVRGPGLGALAGPVDGVMGEQFQRLAHFIEYGPE